MAHYQGFGVNREGTFSHGTPEEQRVHNYKHICPPVSGTLGLPTAGGNPIIDDMQVRFPGPTGIGQFPLRTSEFKIFREVGLPLPAAVLSRVTARLGAAPKRGNALEMWIIAVNDVETYPSQPFRIVQDDYVRAIADNRSGPHTIHWHGIEPSTMNDGVGKHSFEISGGGGGGAGGGSFVYQLHPHQAGTFFYHCHKNTVHHFEMGMFGLMVVDPKAPLVQDGPTLTAPYAFGGPGYAAGRLDTDNPFNPAALNLVRYDQEKIWVADDMDSVWHDHEGTDPAHDHNQQACDPLDPMNPATFHVYGTGDHGLELNNFNPDVFAVSGAVLDYGIHGPGGNTGADGYLPYYFGTVDAPLLSVNVNVPQTGHQKVLLRFLNASYSIVDLRLPVPATVIAMGGFPLGATERTKYSRPYVLPPRTSLASISARRFELIIDTAQLGLTETLNSFGTLTYYDWIKGRPGGVRAKIQIPINITL